MGGSSVHRDPNILCSSIFCGRWMKSPSSYALVVQVLGIPSILDVVDPLQSGSRRLGRTTGAPTRATATVSAGTGHAVGPSSRVSSAAASMTPPAWVFIARRSNAHSPGSSDTGAWPSATNATGMYSRLLPRSSATSNSPHETPSERFWVGSSPVSVDGGFGGPWTVGWLIEVEICFATAHLIADG